MRSSSSSKIAGSAYTERCTRSGCTSIASCSLAAMRPYGKPEEGRLNLMKMARRAILLVVCILAGCATGPAPALKPEAPDLVLYNGKIVTVDAAFSIAQAVAIRGDRFVAVGTNDAVRSTAGPATRQIDLGGRTVVPGLMDGHLHNAGGGPGVDLSRVRSMAQLLAAVEARAKASAPGELIVSNSNWLAAQLAEERLPQHTELDRLAPRTTVGLVYEGHDFISNSAAAA